MKKFLAIAAIALSASASAQMKEGKIVYERTMQLPVRILNLDPSIASQIPKSRTDQYELLFANNQSLWQYLPNANSEGDGGFAGGGVMLRFAGGNDVSYHNFDKALRVDHREVAEKSFIVSDSIRKLDWKLTEETKTILNYTVRKATSQRIENRTRMTMENGEMKRTVMPDTATIAAWFTTDIPVPAGPEYQGQLPGMVLELDIANGQTVYKAVEISPKVSAGKIKEPRDGKKLTADEFNKEREKIMEEMRRNMPNGGNFRIQQ